jgi:hypothetical protein
MQAQEPVEMELSIILQRIRVKLEKHESPPVVLLNAILECLGRPQVPLLSCCKVILASGLDTFIRIIREYDPNEYTKAFCLILSILRQLCRIGGRPAKGRQAVNDNDAIIGRIEENDAVIEDRNGYRIQGVIQTMLNAGIMNALLDAASSCSDDAVEAAIITFLCDFALEENVCEVALPEVLLFLSNNHRRTCKRTACILISRICSDSSAKMVLLDASAEKDKRLWLQSLLPQLWLILLDMNPSSFASSLRIQAAETLVQLYITLHDTEIGQHISDILCNFLLACTDDGEGGKLITSPRYELSSNEKMGLSSCSDDMLASVTLPLHLGVEVACRIVERAATCSQSNEQVLKELRESNLLTALNLCILRVLKNAYKAKDSLNVLQEQFDSAMIDEQARLHTPLAQQKHTVREFVSQCEGLYELLHSWNSADDEVSWNIRIMMQRYGFAEEGNAINVDILVLFKNLDVAEELSKTWIHDLQLGSRLSSLKNELDKAAKANNLSKRTPAIQYEPAIPEAYHPRDPIQTFKTMESLRDEDAHDDEGMLGYMLLKRLYERNGHIPHPHRADDQKALMLAMHKSETDPDKHAGDTISFTNAQHDGTPVTDEVLDATLAKMEHYGYRTSKKNHNSKNIEFDNLVHIKQNSASPLTKRRTGTKRSPTTMKEPTPPRSELRPSRSPISRSSRNHVKEKDHLMNSHGKKRVPPQSSVAAKFAPYSIDTLLALSNGIDSTYITQPHIHHNDGEFAVLDVGNLTVDANGHYVAAHDLYRTSFSTQSREELPIPNITISETVSGSGKMRSNNGSSGRKGNEADADSFKSRSSKGMKLSKIKIIRS